MTTGLSRVLLAIACVLAASPALSQGAPPDSAIASWLTSRVDNGYANGIVVGILDQGKARFISRGGNESSGKGVDGESIFEIGSITKAFTNILLADMVQHGEVALNDPVSKYLPASVKVPSRGGKEITLLDLATASSGLPSLPSNMSPKDPGNPYADYTVAQIYDFLSSHELRRDPGALYEYSNLGMGLLGHALALRAGKSYEQLLTERVLDPLGMRDTRITLSPSMARRFAIPHDGDLDVAKPWDIPTMAGAGALRSSARDMLRLVDALTNRDKGPLAAAISMAIEPLRPTTTPNMRIALGWHVREVNGQRIVWHNGGTGGFRTFLGFNPATGANVVVLSNTAQGVDDIGFHTLDPSSQLRATPPQPNETVADSLLTAYVGRYPLAPTFVVEITRDGERLFGQATNQPKLRLWAASSSDFYLRAVNAKVTFARDSTGAMVLTLDQGGNKQRARKQ